MKETKIKVDLNSETHRNASDCTRYYCMKAETNNFLNTTKNVQLEKERGQYQQSETGRLS